MLFSIDFGRQICDNVYTIEETKGQPMRLKKTTTRDVPSFWAEGLAAANHGGQYWTDGLRLYSYHLQIGDTVEGANARPVKVLRDYSANGRHGFQSMTTSKHVGYARVHADLVDG